MRYLSSFYWQQEEPAATSLVLQQFVHRKGKEPGMFACICTDRRAAEDIRKTAENAGQSAEDMWQSAENAGQSVENTGNAYLAERLTYWFQTEGRELFRMDKSEEVMETRKRLVEVIAQADEDWERYCFHKGYAHEGDAICLKPDLIGLISAGERFLLFYRGKQGAYLLNRRFERVHCRCLTGQDETEEGKKLPKTEKKVLKSEGKMQKMSEELQLFSGEMEPGIGLLLATEDFSKKLEKRQLEECLSVKEMERTENVKGRLRELGEEAARKGGHHMGAVLLLTRGGKEYGV